MPLTCNWRALARRALAFTALFAGIAACAQSNDRADCVADSGDVLSQAPFVLSAKGRALPCRFGGQFGPEFQGTLLEAGRKVRYAAFLHGTNASPEAYIVFIVGGPGTRVLDGLRFDSGPREFVTTLTRRCKAALVVPAYTGTGDNSNYPQSSIDDSIADLNLVLKRVRQAADGRPVIVVTSSLGTYLYANSQKGLVDAHIGILPFLRQPQAFMAFVINDTSRGTSAELARNRWRKFRIGPDGTEQMLRTVDFTRAFFGQSRFNTTSLAEAYRLNPASPEELAKTLFFIGENDIEVGPASEFVPELAASGLPAIGLNTNGHSINSGNAAEILDRVSGILPANCSL